MTLWAFKKENLPIVLDAILLKALVNNEYEAPYAQSAYRAYKRSKNENVTCFWERSGGTFYIDVARDGVADTYRFQIPSGKKLRFKRTVEAVKLRGHFQGYWYPRSYEGLKEKFGCVNKRTA